MCNSIRAGKKRINHYIVHFFTVRNCDPNCGVNVGYEYFDPAPPEHAFGNISLEHPNVSHDLRLYNTIRRFYNKPLIKDD